MEFYSQINLLVLSVFFTLSGKRPKGNSTWLRKRGAGPETSNDLKKRGDYGGVQWEGEEAESIRNIRVSS